jgi:hypothetical protein
MKHDIENFIKLLDNYDNRTLFFTPDIYGPVSSVFNKQECIERLRKIDAHWSTIEDRVMFEIVRESPFMHWNNIDYKREERMGVHIDTSSVGINNHAKYMKEWNENN